MPSNAGQKLPRQLTTFVGREEDLAEITGLLAGPGCRLLTLVGPGGIGKTRLAVEAASRLSDNFGHGIYFVPLQGIERAAFLFSAIIDALELPGRGQDERESLLQYLGRRELLLILDNFEQLLSPSPDDNPGGESLISEMLAAAPGIKLLLTSREVLNLQEEWLHTVHGLSYPAPTLPQEAEAEMESYGAVSLFVERAGQVRRDFSLAAERAAVARICQLVEGAPLALELAASWTKTLPCDTIAAEIERNLDFLATSMRNVPDRHRSMQAVFDYSWQRLTAEEQHTFKRLTVFRGGFRRAAAERVAGASLHILSALVDKSLLRWDPNQERYQIHELLRQYAVDQLAQSPAERTRVHDLHADYYADFLRQLAADLEGGRQQAALREIEAELGNVRAAWHWAVQQGNLENIQKAAYSFYHFCDFQGRYQEGAESLEAAIKKVDRPQADGLQRLALALLLVLLGFHYIRLGRIAEAKTVFSRAQGIYRELDLSPPPGFGTDPLIGLAHAANILGDFEEAAELGRTALQLNEARGDKHNLQIVFYVLTDTAIARGQYDAAQGYAQRAYALTQETHNRWMMAYILGQLGNVARASADYDQARRHYQASYTIKQELNDPEGMAAALNQMARIGWQQQAYQEAEQWYQQSRTIYREINDRGGLATSLHGLGEVALAGDDLGAAAGYFKQALEIAADIRWTPAILATLSCVAELLHQTDQTEQSIELLALILHHAASDHETKTRANQLLDRLQADLPPDVVAAAHQRGQHSNLETAITLVSTELIVLEDEIGDPKPIGPGRPESVKKKDELPPPPTSPELVEQLTPRELEVLQLIAEGQTNRQIATELTITVGTVKSYTSQIYGKLEVNNRTQAVARARELELLA